MWPEPAWEVGPLLTHVECDGDDVEGHGGVCDAAERGRLPDPKCDSSED